MDQEKLDGADDSDDVKATLISLIIEQASAGDFAHIIQADHVGLPSTRKTFADVQWSRPLQSFSTATSARSSKEGEMYALEPDLCGFYRGSGEYLPWDPGPLVAETYGIKYSCPLADGRRLFNAGRVAAAIRAYEQALAVNGKDGEAWRMLGCCYAESDNDAMAIRCLKEALQVDPTNRPVLLTLGISLANEQMFADAVSILRKWITHHPRLSELHEEANLAEDEMIAGRANASEEVPRALDSNVDPAVVASPMAVAVDLFTRASMPPQ
eukprot:COSAG02_NODE_669_length_18681_cov_170.310499_11_plen_269_part_00